MDIANERSYSTPFTNSTLLPLLLLSLATQRNCPRQSMSLKEEYDYIIVGGGSAGSVVASRLSEESCVTVLLLEAGAVEPPLLNEIPSLSRHFWFTNIDWQFKTVPQKNAGFALVNRQVIWPSGKGLGGSSLLNAMLYVRGNKRDYDNWSMQGAKGWSYKEVLPYFLKLEDNRDSDFLKNGYHAAGGPMSVETPVYEGKLKKAIGEAARQLGYKFFDSNGPSQTGFYNPQATIRNGQRCSTAKAYLVPAENRTNIDIIGGAYVRKILFDGSRAVGVHFDHEKSSYQVRARQEVIMSAGTTKTAQLLMLSGIGPKVHLEKLKIPVVADLPVGDNFQDHCSAFIPFSLHPDIPNANDLLKNDRNIKEYINSRTGPLVSAEFVSTVAFLNGHFVSPEEDFPDHELYFIDAQKDVLQNQTGIKPEIYKFLFGPYENGPMYLCASQLLHPKSRGTIRLRSTNPYDSPLIDPNYYDHPQDVKDIVKGLRTCLKIGLSKPMLKIGSFPFLTGLAFPGCAQFILNVDKFLTCVTKSVVVTFSHPVGTAKMGDLEDPTTVVDPLLRVKGIEGLRVVDASVMPTVPSGNTNIPTIMVAEKASDIIKESMECLEAPN